MKDDRERWPEDADLYRVLACPRSIAAGWIVVAILVMLMSLGPATVSGFDAARAAAEHDLAKVEHGIVFLAHSIAVYGHSGHAAQREPQAL